MSLSDIGVAVNVILFSVSRADRKSAVKASAKSQPPH